MSDPRQLVDDYAAKTYGEYSDRLDEIAPEAFAALRAVLDLHKPDNDPSGRVYCRDCDIGEGAPWPCETAEAIITALEQQ